MAALLLAGLCVPLAACVSTSRATAIALDDAKPQYATSDCKAAIKATEVHEDLYIGRLIITPLIAVLTAGAAAPLLLGGNVALDTADRVDASTLSETCGGPAKSAGEIASDVVTNAALGAAAPPPARRLMARPVVRDWPRASRGRCSVEAPARRRSRALL
ncbi:MAG: hypothetical protein EBS91_10035 [Betaproteobacteria bacterium]|nr:hypothetical protein [Betaproteobacteria bacterium]